MTRHASPASQPPSTPCTHPSQLARSNLRPSSRPASQSRSQPSPRRSSASDTQRASRQSRACRGSRAGRGSSLHGSRRRGASRAPHRTAWSSCSAGTEPRPPCLPAALAPLPALHPYCTRTATAQLPAQPTAPPAPAPDALPRDPPPPRYLPRYLPRSLPPALRSGRTLQLCACNKEDLAMWLSTLSGQIEAHQAAADANRRRASARSSSSSSTADTGTAANAPAAAAVGYELIRAATAERAATAVVEPIRIKLYKKEAAAKLGARRTGPDPSELPRQTPVPFPCTHPSPAHPAPALTAPSPPHAAPPSPRRPPSPPPPPPPMAQALSSPRLLTWRVAGSQCWSLSPSRAASAAPRV